MVTHLLASFGVKVLFSDLGRSVREAFEMFWETLWAIVLGFSLSGVIQAFVSRSAMQRTLGHRHLKDLTLASLFGMVSSSCSYAASSMARSLVVRGADFLAAMVFMFASTNLVVELGLILLVLIGWQFVVAEFLGGAIMIVLLVLIGGLWFRGKVLADAQRTALSTVGAMRSETTDEETEGQSFRSRLSSLAAWSDAASYTIGDLTMLRRELAMGFGVAGFLATLVSGSVWGDLFLHGHGVWTTLENVAVGPLVAVASFVCSVGNIPLAAALWKGGISFGGVVSFVFADLITLPLLFIYRKQYGWRMTMRMLGVFWLSMSFAGLIVEGLFRLLHLLPRTRPRIIAANAVGLNYTTGLDIVALIVLALLYRLYWNRKRLGSGTRYAVDPVCGMQVERGHAPAQADVAHQRVYFCSEHCRDRFVEAPGRYLHELAGEPIDGRRHRHSRPQ